MPPRPRPLLGFFRRCFFVALATQHSLTQYLRKKMVNYRNRTAFYTVLLILTVLRVFSYGKRIGKRLKSFRDLRHLAN